MLLVFLRGLNGKKPNKGIGAFAESKQIESGIKWWENVPGITKWAGLIVLVTKFAGSAEVQITFCSLLKSPRSISWLHARARAHTHLLHFYLSIPACLKKLKYSNSLDRFTHLMYDISISWMWHCSDSAPKCSTHAHSHSTNVFINKKYIRKTSLQAECDQ